MGEEWDKGDSGIRGTVGRGVQPQQMCCRDVSHLGEER